jgi:hypothetical protein
MWWGTWAPKAHIAVGMSIEKVETFSEIACHIEGLGTSLENCWTFVY